MHTSKILILAAYFFVAVLAVAQDKELYSYQKRTTKEFSLGPRYGRSREGVPMQRSGKLQVVPRSDVFYLGPRYGKRSSDPPGSSGMYPPQLCSDDNDFSCDYTGISNLYRCIPSFRKDSSIEDFTASS